MRLPDIAQRLYKGAQLLFQFDDSDLEGGTRSPLRIGQILAAPTPNLTSSSEKPTHLRRRDQVLESQARQLLRALGANKLAREARVEWNPRLKTCAGRADYRKKLISMNSLLRDLADTLNQDESGADKLDRLKRSSLTSAPGGKSRRGGVARDEIDRTLRHELAHLLAQWRVGRRRIAPHGAEWRRACRDLGIDGEARCHNLPFAAKVYAVRFVYCCPKCRQEFPRVRRIRREIACLACCRKSNGGDFDPRFRLKLVR
jgi:SprT protein